MEKQTQIKKRVVVERCEGTVQILDCPEGVEVLLIDVDMMEKALFNENGLVQSKVMETEIDAEW